MSIILKGEVFLPQGRVSEKRQTCKVACCPKCGSVMFSRLRRTLLRRLISKELKLYCHDCHDVFWEEWEV